MQIVIEIPDAPIEDYQDLFHKIYGMAASEGLFDDKIKSQRALVLKAVLDILDGITNGIPLPEGHGDIVDIEKVVDMFWDGNSMEITKYDLSIIEPIIKADRKGE